MAAKKNSSFVCDACGHVSSKWAGKCDACGEWNTIKEFHIPKAQGKKASLSGASYQPLTFEKLSDTITPPPRISTSLEEFDRVLGGGIVPGGVILLGGNPGIGKSTLLLQVLDCIAEKAFPQDDHACVYISGEESINQIRLRAQRMDITTPHIKLSCATDVSAMTNAFSADQIPKIMIIDSIQTMYLPHIDTAPGTVTQVRASAAALIQFAKENNVAVFLVGHVTKEGTIAGPRVLEHMVDTVLYFEGDHNHQFRILRSVKNRFGPAHEMGVFDMTSTGLKEITNPSELFLGERTNDIPGSCIFAGVEGSRPLLVEIQALVSPTSLAMPRRTSIGWDMGRLSMILAVLETHAGFTFSNKDIYLNVAGGLRISEPASDLAVAIALISSFLQKAVPPHVVAFGEISLNGDIRSVSHHATRLFEAEKLGFSKALQPSTKDPIDTSLKLILPQNVRRLRHFFETMS